MVAHSNPSISNTEASISKVVRMGQWRRSRGMLAMRDADPARASPKVFLVNCVALSRLLNLPEL